MSFFSFLREIKKPLVFITIVFALSVWLGYYSGQVHSAEAKALVGKLSEDLGKLKDINAVAMFLFIFANNAVKSFVMSILGMFFGIAPIIFIIVNGLLIGVTASVIVLEKGMKFLLMGTVPHGVLEVPAFLIAAAIGLRLGRRYYRSIRHRDPFRPFFGRSVRELLRIVVPLLIVASFIETFITSLLLRSL